MKGRRGRRWAGSADGEASCGLGLFAFEGGAAGLASVGAFAGFLEAIGLAFNLHDLGVVCESVKKRHDVRSTLKDLMPLRKRLVGGDDRGDALISAGDDLEEQVSGARVVAEITKRGA